MRKPHIYALTVSLALTVTLVVVVGGDPAPEPERIPSIAAVEIVETTSTTLDLEVSPAEVGAIVLSAAEEALTEEAARTATTTTTTPPLPKKTSASKPPSTSPPATSPTTTAPSTSFEPGTRADYESEFRGKINSLRSANGLAELTGDGSLNARARDWAKTMADSGKLMHSSLGSLVPPWSAAGENVGMGESVSSVFDRLKASSGHLSNMLGNYTHFGVGVYQDSSGRIWTVHVFTR